MASAQLIDLSNYDTMLVQSAQSRSGVPTGNVFFDVTNGRIEVITAEELANVDLHGGITTGAITIDANAAGTFTRSTGSFLTDGFKAGRQFAASGFTNGGNNATFTIATVTATVITVTDNTGMVTETGGGDEVIASVAEPNPLTNQTGIKLEALYAFERQERRTDENLRKYDYYFRGTFKFGGAYEIVNGRKFDDADGSATSNTVDDRFKIRGSGWIERAANGSIGRIFYGVKSLGNVEAASQPYYQLSNGGAPVNFDKAGSVDEAIQVYGDNAVDANAYTTSVATAAAQTISVVAAAGTFTRSAGDFTTDGFQPGHRFTAAGLANNTGTYTVDTVTATVITIVATEWATLTDETGNADEVLTVNGFDTRTYMSMKVRSFGYNYDEKILTDSGVTEMGGYSSGFALSETAHLTSGGFTLADVYGGAQISPWTGMTLEKLGVAQTETGFNEADGDFTWVLNNVNNGTLDQCVAFLDALAQTDDDIDTGAGVTNGKRVGTWYTYDAQGRIVTRSGADTLGLFIENVPTADEQRIVFTDDAGATKTRPFNVQVEVSVGATAVADILAWYHAFFLDGPAAADFNTSGALTVVDNAASPVKGNVATDAVTNKIIFGFDYDGDTVGGTAGTDKDVVFECEGDGGATAAKTVFTITRTTTVSASCEPGLEANV